MKIERQLFNISIPETFLYFILSFVLINCTLFIYTIFQGNPRFMLSDSSWIYQIVFPVMFTLVHKSNNRNGELKLKNISDIDIVKNKIDMLILKKGLIKIDKESGFENYGKKTKLGRFFNLFIRENIKVKFLDKEILIYGKKHMLSLLVSQLKND
ncbi:hypothetical protein OU798_02490 [Prolixibacteraceae bacterium Z1-6]|uniref:Uncharacterized protein n=1 Tax=Draconibacterium aestuarii TaxID=2998507 RepID=A0A9X3J591_9BACT|nr:hypothetical protein [Prolixibacteraceae bacterium Z1-6]